MRISHPFAAQASLAVKYGVGAEDLRVFDAGGRTMVLHYDYDASRAAVRPHLSELAADGRLLETRVLVPPFAPQNCEKNWCPFVYRGDVRFSYSLQPHRVLELRTGAGCASACVESRATGAAPPCPSRTDLGLRGSTNFLRSSAGYVGFAHTRGPRGYLHHFVLFEHEPPFQITTISRPFTFLEGARGAEFATTIQLVDSTSLRGRRSRPQRKVLLVSVGVRDTHTRFLVCETTDVAAALRIPDPTAFAWE